MPRRITVHRRTTGRPSGLESTVGGVATVMVTVVVTDTVEAAARSKATDEIGERILVPHDFASSIPKRTATLALKIRGS